MIDAVDDILEEYVEERHRFERKPYWLYLKDERGREMEWDLFDYFPEAHYTQAITKQVQEDWENEILPDGGRRTQYYWVGDEGVLYHTEKDEDIVIPFFDTVEDAETFLENQADRHGEDRYKGMVLRKTGNQKVEEAVEVLTSQSGIGDFVPDGGTDPRKAYAWFEKGSTTSGKQPIIDDLGMGKLYYFFKTERDADSFMREYMKQYGVTDLSRYERVEVEITDIVDGEEALGFKPESPDIDQEKEGKSEDQIDFSEF